jgi:hypothetical protein
MVTFSRPRGGKQDLIEIKINLIPGPGTIQTPPSANGFAVWWLMTCQPGKTKAESSGASIVWKFFWTD